MKIAEKFGLEFRLPPVRLGPPALDIVKQISQSQRGCGNCDFVCERVMLDTTPAEFSFLFRRGGKENFCYRFTTRKFYEQHKSKEHHLPLV
jgi:hypothetical protein